MKEWKLLSHPLLLPYAGGSLPKPAPVIYYKVIYRTGRVDSFQWHETLGTHRLDKANELADGLRRRGSRPEIIPEGIFEVKGLPDSFRAHNFYRDP